MSLAPKEAIKIFCLHFCCQGSKDTVENCIITMCPFYNFRDIIIKEKKKLTEEQKEILKERLVKARIAKREKIAAKIEEALLI